MTLQAQYTFMSIFNQGKKIALCCANSARSSQLEKSVGTPLEIDNHTYWSWIGISIYTSIEFPTSLVCIVRIYVQHQGSPCITFSCTLHNTIIVMFESQMYE